MIGAYIVGLLLMGFVMYLIIEDIADKLDNIDMKIEEMIRQTKVDTEEVFNKLDR